jgi:hypothetical protein
MPLEKLTLMKIIHFWIGSPFLNYKKLLEKSLDNSGGQLLELYC